MWIHASANGLGQSRRWQEGQSWDGKASGKEIISVYINLGGFGNRVLTSLQKKIGTLFYNPGGPGEEPSTDLSEIASAGAATTIRLEYVAPITVLALQCLSIRLSQAHSILRTLAKIFMWQIARQLRYRWP